MEPEPDSLFCGLQFFLVRHANSEDDPSKISQIEQVMRFGWCREELLHGCLINLQGGLEYLWLCLDDICIEAIGRKVPFQDSREDSVQGLVLETGQ